MERLSQFGNLYQIGNFKNGQKEGEWNIYNKNGKPLSIEIYVDGKTKEITGKLSYLNFNITEEKRVKRFWSSQTPLLY